MTVQRCGIQRSDDTFHYPCHMAATLIHDPQHDQPPVALRGIFADIAEVQVERYQHAPLAEGGCGNLGVRVASQPLVKDSLRIVSVGPQ